MTNKADDFIDSNIELLFVMILLVKILIPRLNSSKSCGVCQNEKSNKFHVNVQQ